MKSSSVFYDALHRSISPTFSLKSLRQVLSGAVPLVLLLAATVAHAAAPIVTIATPADGSTVDFGTSINFQAGAVDLEDDDVELTAKITWSSNLDGALGTTGSISIDTLSVGTHIITAAVTDLDAEFGFDAITVTINSLPTVTILTPADASNFNFGANINFQASAADFEDNNVPLTNSISWSSDVDGALESASSINVSTLSLGVHVITASVTDTDGGQGSDSITVTINNNAPTVTILAPADGSNIGSGVLINFLASANDIEDDNLELIAKIAWTSDVDGALGTGGSIDVGTLSVGPHVITAAVTDTGGESGSNSIAVTIANSAPTVTITAPADNSGFNFGTPISFQAGATDLEDNDVELTAAIAWTSDVDGALDTGGSINIATLSVGAHVITAAVTDSDGGLGSASINVTISNNAPTVTITSPADNSEFISGVAIPFTATATDVEDDDATLTAAIAWTSDVDGVLGAGGSISPSTLTIGAHVITAAVTDSDGGPGSAFINVTITNTVPTASNVVITGTPAVGEVLEGTYDYADAEDDLEGASTYRWLRDEVAIPFATATSYTVVAADKETALRFEVTPVAATGFTDGLPVQSADFLISNTTPSITEQVVIDIAEDTSRLIELADITVVDADSTFPDDFTLIVQDGANYTRDLLDGNIITPILDYEGPLTVPVIVNDGFADSPVFNMLVTVLPINDAPIIVDVVPQLRQCDDQEPVVQLPCTPEDTTLTIVLADLDIVDPDNVVPDELTLTLLPPGPTDEYTLAGDTAITPTPNFSGQLLVAATVSDTGEPIGVSAPFLIPVTVKPVNDLPVLVTPIGPQQAVENSLFELDITANFSDDDVLDVLTYAVTWDPVKPPNIAFDTETGIFSGTPQLVDADEPGPVYTVTVTASDPLGEFVSNTFDLTISALGRANLGLSIDVTPDTGLPGEQLRWTFTSRNPVGPVPGVNVELTGSFVGLGLTVSVESGASCTTTVIAAANRADFVCTIGALPVGGSNAIVISTTVSETTEVVAFATSAGAQPLPIDPNLDDNTVLRAVGIAESFSAGAVQVLGSSSIRSVAAGDVNGDGEADLVIGTAAGQPVQIFFNDAPRESCDCQRDFQSAPISIPDNGSNEGVALGHFNADNFLDLVIANGGGQADVVYANDGAGNFTLMATLAVSNANDVAVGDFNNDGNMDIAVAASSPNPVYFGNGNGGFSAPTLLGDADSIAVAVGRFDSNGRDDLAFANVGSPSAVWVNSGGTAFTLQDTLVNMGDAAAVAAADLDLDGDDDLVFGRVSGSVGDIPSNPVLINPGTGDFGNPTSLLGLSPTNDVLIGDVSEDGLPDLVFINSSGVHQVWIGSGGGNFTLHPEQIIEVGAFSGVLTDLGFADNADPGGVDLAMGGAALPGIGVYLNDSFGNLGRGDAVAPTLTLRGEASVSVPAKTTYVDAGASADDNVDGDLSARVTVSNPVNTSIVGAYTVTYNVQDFAGNTAVQISRTVNVTPNSGGGGGGGGGGTLSYWLLSLLLAVILVRNNNMKRTRTFGVVAFSAVLLLVNASPTQAQEIRYSWLDMSYVAQDIDRAGVQLPIPGQSVEIAGSDGSGVRFRGSMGAWKNLYFFVNYASTDISVDAVVTNDQGTFDASDEFDFTTIRGGVGYKYSIFQKTDIFAEVSYDSMDFDFGSFAGESFDADAQEIGGALGIRTMFGDHFELKVQGRYAKVGDIDLNALAFDTDTLFSVGFAWELIRGFSIVGDFESGEFSNYALGFRLDLDED
jgi:hypothetical protein